uniref:Homoserine dehydrogenase n=1 Tax=Fervidicoccus fontis TaxID=683846 RepID=A0A7J3ZK67_9CREN
MRNVKLAVIGFGNVGRAFIKTIALKRMVISMEYGIEINVVAVADSKGMVVEADGLTSYEMLKLCELLRSEIRLFSSYAKPSVDIAEIYDKTAPDIHVELTPSNYATGEPGYTNIMFAIKRGAHVVTANKAPLALHFREIIEEARARKLEVKFGATVMGGTPFLEVLSSMRSHDIERAEGILNATTNYILTEMHEEPIDFDEAPRRAQALGVAEADPTLDIKGFDAAAKLTIISHVVGKPIRIDEVRRESLAGVKLKDVLDAVKQRRVLKYIASLDLREKSASVKIEKVPRSSIFARVSGTLNRARVKSDAAELFLIGKGGGGTETAHTVLDDVIDIALRWLYG